jgi:hypothetical protein
MIILYLKDKPDAAGGKIFGLTLACKSQYV